MLFHLSEQSICYTGAKRLRLASVEDPLIINTGKAAATEYLMYMKHS